MVLRSRWYHCVSDLVHLYKTHALSFVEYRTHAIYHAKREYLRRLDDAQDHFLRDLGIDAESALVEFNLAPLRVRRDLAMLGLLHRTALGKGPRHFAKVFKSSGGNFTCDEYVSAHELGKRSVFGLVRVYNGLPRACRTAASVAASRETPS